MDKKIIIIIIIFIVIICAYLGFKNTSNYGYNDIDEQGNYRITNINIYRDTPAWELALAVKDQRTRTIEKILKNNPQLVNYQDPMYGATLLLWAVGMEKYKSAETLLKCGADPDIASTKYGYTPLFKAAGFSWVDNEAKNDPKYVVLLLNYGADPNKSLIVTNIPRENEIDEPGTSPLMRTLRCGIEKTKALVEAGADINYKTKSGDTAAIRALDVGGPNATVEGLEYAHYLIVEKKAKVSEPYYSREKNESDIPRIFFPVDILRTWIYDLDSKQYELKMEIVEEFARQGVNYWETEIPEFELSVIKKLYPDTWEEYIKKY